MNENDLTWGDLKHWAETNKVPDDAVMIDDDDELFQDMDFSPTYEDGDGEQVPAEFILQHRYG